MSSITYLATGDGTLCVYVFDNINFFTIRYLQCVYWDHGNPIETHGPHHESGMVWTALLLLLFSWQTVLKA